MTIVKVWAVHWQRERHGVRPAKIYARLYVRREERFRWWLGAWLFAFFCTDIHTICTLHDEAFVARVPVQGVGD